MSEKKKNNPKFTLNSYWIYIPLILFFLAMGLFNQGNPNAKEITSNDFNEMLIENDIEKIMIV